MFDDRVDMRQSLASRKAESKVAVSGTLLVKKLPCARLQL
jgi:hypothetical protein